MKKNEFETKKYTLFIIMCILLMIGTLIYYKYRYEENKDIQFNTIYEKNEEMI